MHETFPTVPVFFKKERKKNLSTLSSWVSAGWLVMEMGLSPLPLSLSLSLSFSVFLHLLASSPVHSYHRTPSLFFPSFLKDICLQCHLFLILKQHTFSLFLTILISSHVNRSQRYMHEQLAESPHDGCLWSRDPWMMCTVWERGRGPWETLCPAYYVLLYVAFHRQGSP